MFKEEKTFNLRFNLEADFPENYDGEEDGYGWLKEWESRIKPEMLKAVFASLRRDLLWDVHVRNRGASTEEEIEIVVRKKTATAPPQ